MKSILFYITLFFTTNSFAWVINANFEEGQVGSKAVGSSAFSGNAVNTIFTKEKVHGGSLAAVSSIKEGETGFGKWGGSFKWSTPLGEGEQIWYRVWIYYPSGFDFTNTGVGVKTLRIHTESSSGANEGYFDMLSRGSSGVTVSLEQTRKEFASHNPDNKGIGPPITTGVWHAFEMYTKLSSVSGKGIYRAWVDGVLVLEDTKSANLISSSSQSDFAYLWTYFNGGSPKDQKAYVDDVIITNEPPNAFDSSGNRFIGVGEAKFTAPPQSGTLVID